jgi:hypothetical protein
MSTIILKETIANEHFDLPEITLDIGPVEFAPVVAPLVCAGGDLYTYKDGLMVVVVERDEDDLDWYTGFVLPFRKTETGFIMSEPQITKPRDSQAAAGVDAEMILKTLYDVQSTISPRGSVVINH